MSEQILSGPGIPSEERIRNGAVACIECFQNIPCNPCEEACPRGAITVGREITGLPTLDAEKCNGCGKCVSACPALVFQSFGSAKVRGIQIRPLEEGEQ